MINKYTPQNDDYCVACRYINPLTKTVTRIIKYTINKQIFYMATNVLDIEMTTIKSIYHDRWDCEEYFKYIKRYTNMNKLEEHRDVNISKTLYAQLIVSQLTFLIFRKFICAI